MDSSLAKVFELSSGNNIKVKITNFGAIITSLFVPDAQGTMTDVVLGFDTLDCYMVSVTPFDYSVYFLSIYYISFQFPLLEW